MHNNYCPKELTVLSVLMEIHCFLLVIIIKQVQSMTVLLKM